MNLFNNAPFLVIVKNYFGDGWQVIEYHSAMNEKVLFKAATHKEAKDFYDAERAKRRGA